MEIIVRSQRIGDSLAKVLIVPVFFESEQSVVLADLDELSGNMFSIIGKGNETTAKKSEITFLPFGERKVVLFGLGSKTQAVRQDIRNCFGVLGRELRERSVETIALDTSELNGEFLLAAVEGLILGNYKFDTYITDRKQSVKSVEIIAENSIEIESAIHTAVITAESINIAREWTNLPPSVCTPAYLADEAKTIAETYGLECTILNRMQMQELGMGGLLAVSRGSAESPKLVVLKYFGNSKSNDCIAYIGKGITFDSGGLSLKPSLSMLTMKHDMAGAASVLAAVKAIAQLQLQANVIAVMPLCENMPGGSALQPGEIIRMLSGKTVEIHSADAEGRIILADAVAYAVHLGAIRLIDVATLTGNCHQTLGNVTAGIVDNDSAWCYEVVAAGAAADERLWRFPNYTEYRELLKSSFADLKNSSKIAGAIAGGLFIGEFVDKCPWVHIDIAGTAWNDTATGMNPAGASGSMVRTLVELAKRQ